MTLSELLVKMGTIVNGYMESYQSDFYVHDTHRLYEYNGSDVKFIWFVYANGTGLFFDTDPQCEAFRNSHAKGYYRGYEIKIGVDGSYEMERVY